MNLVLKFLTVGAIFNDKENSSDKKPSLTNVLNETVLQNQSQPSNALTASINQRTKSLVKGAPDEGGEESISHPSVTENIAGSSKNCVSISRVKEISNDKDNSSDKKPSSTNALNEAVLQNQSQPSNAPTSSINEQTETPVHGAPDEEEEESISHPSATIKIAGGSNNSNETEVRAKEVAGAGDPGGPSLSPSAATEAYGLSSAFNSPGWSPSHSPESPGRMSPHIPSPDIHLQVQAIAQRVLYTHRLLQTIVPRVLHIHQLLRTIVQRVLVTHQLYQAIRRYSRDIRRLRLTTLLLL
ncbi:hypothetical protein QYM36_002291 [Artemia franciscana]|uniref:Uncharacterized protein n=1 Tax=Artemia franciscana TaxID=6661 RepID=A0AA88LB45_ARTSF|nr:hypothetical protein QYM36_002291 [Artemia franciscana]